MAEMPNWALGLIGGYSLVAAWYWSIGVAEVGPGYVKAINVAAHLSPMAIATGVMLFLCGFQVWFYGTIAARCSKLLTDRTFK
ncbi:MAG: hypothetical protein HYT87_07350 [Nitrospirae bacterium]|nr:hypothetical protein [Nitrospirota bacterium]